MGDAEPPGGLPRADAALAPALYIVAEILRPFLQRRAEALTPGLGRGDTLSLALPDEMKYSAPGPQSTERFAYAAKKLGLEISFYRYDDNGWTLEEYKEKENRP